MHLSATAAARASAPDHVMLGLDVLSLVFTAGLRAVKAACDTGTVDPSVTLTAKHRQMCVNDKQTTLICTA